jgi:hypothetical protein
MEKLKVVLVLVIICLLTTSAAALTSDQIIVSPIDDSTDTYWIKAGPGTVAEEKVSYSVSVNNTSVQIQDVSFACLDSEFITDDEGTVVGALTPATDTTTPYQATFSSKKSGVANIKVTVSFIDKVYPEIPQTPVSKIVQQHIDHNVPYVFSTLDYDTELTVDNTTDMHLVMHDKFGNTIDAKRETDEGDIPEAIRFICTPDDSCFYDGDDYLGRDVTRYVDDIGDITIKFKASTQAGPNLIWIDAVTAVPEMWITIDGVGEVYPYSVVTAVNPSEMRLPGDGTSYFTIIYTFYDRFGNPSPNSTVDFTTSLGGEAREIMTNGYGEATIRYGPKTSIGMVKLTTTSRHNTSVESILNLMFTSSDGTSFDVGVNPANMPSADVSPFTPGEIRVLVTDDLGRGVEGEEVSFAINTGSIVNSTTLLNYPKIAATNTTDPNDTAWVDTIDNVKTNANGLAVVYFRPGEFPKSGEAGYEAFARGNCTVTAGWKTYSKETPSIEFRNYPYLRVEAEVSNPTVGPGETFDVTLRLIGDGFELIKRDPIDVVLGTSRAYTMLEEDPDRLTYAMEAEQAFVDVMEHTSADGGVDNIGLLTFGGKSFGNAEILNMDKQWKKLAGADNTESDDYDYVYNYPRYLGEGETDYDEHSYWELDFTSSITDVETAIYLTIPYQDKVQEKNVPVMPLRLAVYDAITALREKPNTIQAVILLVDSDITWYGDVLAEGSYTYAFDSLNGGTNQYYPFPGPDGSWHPDKSVQPLQNMAEYAKFEGVKVYVVYAASKVNNADWTTLNTLASETGGAFNYTYGDAANLEDIYKWIANQLINEAAVGTTADIQMVGFNDPADELNWSATTLLDYVYADGESTYIRFFDWSSSPYVADDYLDGTPLTIDKSDDWDGITPPAENAPAGSFHFDVGNITVKQTWEVTFRMLVNASANDTINFSVFNPNSRITFENEEGSSFMSLPDTLITILPGLTPDPVFTATFQLNETDGEFTGEFYEFDWELDYTGWGDIREEIEYRPSNGGWIRVDTRTVANSTPTDTARIYLKDHPFDTYYFRVVAHTDDAGVRTGTWEYPYTDTGKSYIKIQ